jgi:hypothetical protein
MPITKDDLLRLINAVNELTDECDITNELFGLDKVSKCLKLVKSIVSEIEDKLMMEE